VEKKAFPRMRLHLVFKWCCCSRSVCCSLNTGMVARGNPVCQQAALAVVFKFYVPVERVLMAEKQFIYYFFFSYLKVSSTI